MEAFETKTLKEAWVKMSQDDDIEVLPGILELLHHLQQKVLGDKQIGIVKVIENLIDMNCTPKLGRLK